MMVDRITMDMEELGKLGEDLRQVHEAFQAADASTEGWEAQTGELVFSAAVEHFGDRWKLKREKMLANIETMQQMVKTIAETFVEVDGELAGNLTEGPGLSEPAVPQ